MDAHVYCLGMYVLKFLRYLYTRKQVLRARAACRAVPCHSIPMLELVFCQALGSTEHRVTAFYFPLFFLSSSAFDYLYDYWMSSHFLGHSSWVYLSLGLTLTYFLRARRRSPSWVRVLSNIIVSLRPWRAVARASFG